MPRQNTSPADFPPHILAQIQTLAAHICTTRKARGQSQAHWAQQLGISQPTMARLEKGDPSVSTATYLMCLWLADPGLDVRRLLPTPGTATLLAAPPPKAQPVDPPSLRADRAPAPAPTAPAPASDVASEFADLLQRWRAPAL